MSSLSVDSLGQPWVSSATIVETEPSWGAFVAGRALAIAVAAFGEGHPIVARFAVEDSGSLTERLRVLWGWLLERAQWLHRGADFLGAHRAARGAVRVAELAVGRHHPAVAYALRVLAEAYEARGGLTWARHCRSRALRIERRWVETGG